MTSPGYKKGKRFRWIILRAALWVEISKQARVEGGKFQGWILRTRTHARTGTHAHSARKLPSEKALFFLLRSLFKIYPKSFDFVSFQPLPPPSPATTYPPSRPPPSLPRPVPAALPRTVWGMPVSMFSIDNILAARPRCKDSVLLPPSAAPVVFPSLHGDSLYGSASDYGGFYSRAVAPASALPPAVTGSRLGYNNYYYGQLHVPASPVGPSCCGAVPPLGAQQCSCVPPAGKAAPRGTGRTGSLCSRRRGAGGGGGELAARRSAGGRREGASSGRDGTGRNGTRVGGSRDLMQSLSSTRLSVRRLRGHWLSPDVPCSPSDVALHERGHFVPDGAAVTEPAALQAKKTAPDYLY